MYKTLTGRLLANMSCTVYSLTEGSSSVGLAGAISQVLLRFYRTRGWMTQARAQARAQAYSVHVIGRSQRTYKGSSPSFVLVYLHSLVLGHVILCHVTALVQNR
jgi:hypothetical protein